MNVAGHDSNFTFTRTDDTGAVRTNQACRFVRQKLFYLHHVERGDAFGNAYDYRNACIGSFHDSVRRECRRHIDYGSVSSCFLDRVGNGVEDRNAFVCRTALTRSYTTNNVGAILDHLFCMKCTLPAGNSLHDEARRLIDKNTHLFSHYEKLLVCSKAFLLRAEYSNSFATHQPDPDRPFQR